MARIVGSGTKPELTLTKLLQEVGLKFEAQATLGRWRADFLLPDAKLVILVDGCQWHGCPAHYVPPRTNTDFWSRKLLTNVRRDVSTTRVLRRLGFRVLRIWEHELRRDTKRVVAKISMASGGKRIRFNTARVWRVTARTLDWEVQELMSLRGEYLPSRTRRRFTTKT